MKGLIPVDVLLSSFDCIEGGVIILNPEGGIVYLNDWVQKNSVKAKEDYQGLLLTEAFCGDVSSQLVDAVDGAVSSSLSRVLSHKMHKKILPFYRDKVISEEHALNVSALVSPLQGSTGILIRIVDYTSLVKREKQNRVNEALLMIERDYFNKASDLAITLDQFIADLVKELSDNVYFMSVRFSLLKKNVFSHFSDYSDSQILKKSEQMILHHTGTNDELLEALKGLGAQGGKSLGVMDFSIENMKGIVELVKESDHILDISFEKTADKIKGLLFSLIEWKISYEKLNYMAIHDELTGLYNRSYLGKKFTALSKEVEKEVNGEGALILFFIDLNKFKNINDQFGHRFGDKVLIKVAQKIKACLAPDDIAFRIGGDEFLVIKKGRQPEEYQQSLKLKIASPFLCGPRPISISASIGAAVFPQDGRTLDELIHLADEKMYAEK
jgi:diguanylate cyclase (GGDEF)-like protein